MTINWAQFAPALLLLLYPADWLLSARAELCSFDCLFGLGRRNWARSWWWRAALLIDPLRGFAGAWLAVQALDLHATSWTMTPKAEFTVLVVLVSLAVLCQTFTRRDHGVLLAPIGFVGGAALALVPGFTPYFCLALALLAMAGFRQFYAFFAAGLCALPALGFLLAAAPAKVGAACPLFLLPLLAGMLSHSALELPWHQRSDS